MAEKVREFEDVSDSKHVRFCEKMAEIVGVGFRLMYAGGQGHSLQDLPDG